MSWRLQGWGGEDKKKALADSRHETDAELDAAMKRLEANPLVLRITVVPS